MAYFFLHPLSRPESKILECDWLIACVTGPYFPLWSPITDGSEILEIFRAFSFGGGVGRKWGDFFFFYPDDIFCRCKAANESICDFL